MDCRIERGKYKVVFSDIDGTLLNTSHQIARRTKEKIMEVNGQGVPFILVSARMPKGMTGIRDELGVRNPMVCYSGALVVDGDLNPLYSVAIKKDDARALCEAIRAAAPQVSVNIYSNDCWMAENLEEYWVAQEMDITGVQAREISFQEDAVFQEVHKILCMGKPEEISFLEEKLKKDFPDIRIYRSKDTYLEIVSMEASKSDAAHMLKNKLGVHQEEILSFGDGHNDIDILRYAGLGVAMGNADDEVKLASDYVTDSNDREGLRQVLDMAF